MKKLLLLAVLSLGFAGCGEPKRFPETQFMKDNAGIARVIETHTYSHETILVCNGAVTGERISVQIWDTDMQRMPVAKGDTIVVRAETWPGESHKIVHYRVVEVKR